MDQESLTISTYAPLIVMALLFYFLLYRPHKNEQKKHHAMLETLKKGSRVMTAGGIYGEVVAVDDQKVRLQVADNVEIEVALAAISADVSSKKES